MTDEEIEKALTQCGDLSEFDCTGCPLEGNALCFSIIRENALNYINRLKAKNKELQDKNRRVLDWKRRQEKFNNEMIDRFDEELKKQKEQIRKDTAKEILQEVYKLCGNLVADNSPDSIDFMDFARAELLTDLCQKYGVEVDE